MLFTIFLRGQRVTVNENARAQEIHLPLILDINSKLLVIMSDEKEVKVTYKPYEEIIILEYTEYPLDLFIELEGMPARAGELVLPLNWAEGVVFRHSAFPPKESVLEELRKGRLYWAHVAFALMPKFSSQATTKDGRVTVNILDQTNNSIMRAAARWVKQQAKVRTPNY